VTKQAAYTVLFSATANYQRIFSPYLPGNASHPLRENPWQKIRGGRSLGGIIMKRQILRTNVAKRSTLFLLATCLLATWQVQAQEQNARAPYPSMAPVEQYMTADRNAEIALARSAGPASVSSDAEVLVLGRHGYETAVKGKNGFVCLVERSWTAPSNDPGFWNPKLRGPICLNAAAARSYLPLTIKKTEVVLAGGSKAQMFESIKVGLDKKELPTPEAGAMAYMLSKEQYLGDSAQHWHPHLMIFVPLMDTATWGANMTDSPVFGADDPEDRLTIFFVPVGKWSDGTADSGH
jgi:hypothetical protein